MEKFNVRLNQGYSCEIGQILKQNNVRVRHIDDILNDFIIVDAMDKVHLTQFSFIRSVKKTRVGRLLDIPKNQQLPKMKAIPSPNIDINTLQDNGLYGLGSKVAVIDSGHDVEKCGNVEMAVNFTNHPNYYDTVGHGSLVITLLKQTVPAAKIYSAKVCINADDIDEENVIKSLSWVTTLPDVKIINLSLGIDANCLGDCDLADKINAMWDLGYVVICAMGNKGKSTAHCPACAEGAISVGALDRSGKKVTSFSSSGHINSNKPDLVAQGQGDQFYLGRSHPYSGTSFSAPIVTGVVGATYHMFKPQKNVKEYITTSCDTLVNVPVTKQGSGKINLQKLLEEIEREKI